MLFFIIILAQECCAIKIPLRIYGGIDAKSEEYPFVVRIEARYSYNVTNKTSTTVIARHEHLCTASALSPVWLISAAHCIVDKYPIVLKNSPGIIERIIRYGHVENSPWTKHSFSDILYTIMHPQYVSNKVGNGVIFSRNDIGLLKTTPMEIRSFIKISAVDYKTVFGHKAIIGGFGRMATKDADGKLVTNHTLHLMKPLQLLHALFTKCRSDDVLIPALCMTSRCGETTSLCSGDSGGPVIHPSGLLGVVVLGKLCLRKLGLVSRAGTAIPVSPYIDWIYRYVYT